MGVPELAELYGFITHNPLPGDSPPSSVIRPLSSVIRPLSSVIRPPSSALEAQSHV